MLTKEKKRQIVEDLVARLKESQAIFLVDPSNLKVKDDRQLRSFLKEVGGEIKMAKKTLVQRAFQRIGLKFNVYQFPGSIALIFGPEEGVMVAKQIYKFLRINESLKILGGFLQNNFISPKTIEELANLPSREVLISKLIFLINLGRTWVGVLNNNFLKLVIALEAITKKKS